MPDKKEYYELFLSTGWNEEYHCGPEELEKANAGSTFVLAAYDNGKLVGFGRVVSDMVLHAMVYDMIVLPEYQGRGIGSTILNALVQRCQAHNIREVQLFCAKGKRSFYERNGFEARPIDAPGMQWRTELPHN